MEYFLKFFHKKSKLEIAFLKNILIILSFSILQIPYFFIKSKINRIQKLNKKYNKNILLHGIRLYNINKINLLFYLFIIFSSIIPVMPQNIKIYKYIKHSYSNEIRIKILGFGNQNILYSGFGPQPNEVTINEISYSIDEENEISNLQNEENIITLKWNNQLESCNSMFMGLDNIIEVDLSNFDSSKVTDMNKMFYNCTNIQIIKMNNIDTSSVTDMSFMFYNCQSLISLDISNLNTISVNTLLSMFSNCISIKSLDLSSFDTSKVTTMSNLYLVHH